MSHDQNFKNLILDYPREALAFFAESEAGELSPEVRITPIRQEQLKPRLGEGFRELDCPLLVEWPDGHRAAILFAVEHEREGRRFSIHRLVHYCADLAELCRTDRVVPVVVFLRGGPRLRTLELGSERRIYLRFDYIACELGAMAAADHLTSPNLVARLNLPNMSHSPDLRVAVYAAAVRGLASLEPDPEKQIKYLDFIDIYAALDDNERHIYRRDYPEEADTVTRFAERFREQGLKEGMQQGMRQGMQQGMQQGMRQGEAAVLLRLLGRRFGELPEPVRRRIDDADADTLLLWSDRVLTAQSLEEIIH